MRREEEKRTREDRTEGSKDKKRAELQMQKHEQIQRANCVSEGVGKRTRMS